MHIKSWKVIKTFKNIGRTYIFEAKRRINLQNTLMHISNFGLRITISIKFLEAKNILSGKAVYISVSRPVSILVFYYSSCVFYWVLKVWKSFLRKTLFKKFRNLKNSEKNARTRPALTRLIYNVNIVDKTKENSQEWRIKVLSKIWY